MSEFDQWWETEGAFLHQNIQDAFENGTNGDIANTSYALANAAWQYCKSHATVPLPDRPSNDR